MESKYSLFKLNFIARVSYKEIIDFVFTFFCRVKLITNNSGEAIAVKIVDFHKHPDALQNLKKEVAIHRMTKHENIIHFFGHRRDNTCEYIFLEYASGGELFDRIGELECSNE